MEDILTIATADGVRIYAITTKNLVQEAADRHHTSHLATAALGRAMSGALMLAATMKDGERIALKLKGDGPMGEVVAEAQGTSVRGYVGNPDVFMPLKDGKLDIGGALGQGTITLTRYLQNGESFTGHAELANGEIATDITNYLYMSEQTPSSVALGVLVDKDGKVLAAGGYFIQAMPGCEEKVLEKLGDNVSKTPYVTQLLELGYTPEKIIETLTRGLDCDIKESLPVKFACNCSRDKILNMLATLNQSDIDYLTEQPDTEVHCQYCNKIYHITSEELKQLAAK
ncbi:MAG: Hsp33 family molecular chaperone HslO [Phascolarctobacterium sp.]|nr:MAG: Hsp33 family molecular chaperone HslO [Phascolarctobacterium sp.]